MNEIPKLTAKNEKQKEYIRAIKDNQVVLCKGPAGTAKTSVAAYCAVNDLRKDKIDQIIITRPLMTAGEEFGLLPGDINEKFEPFVAPVKYEIEKWSTKDEFKKWHDEGKIKYIPLAFTRGLNYHNSFIILDEAQNCTKKELLLLLTRLGDNSKCVVTGDLAQSDFKYVEQLNNLAFSYAYDNLYDLDGVYCIEFTKHDIVRNDLIGKIITILTD